MLPGPFKGSMVSRGVRRAHMGKNGQSGVAIARNGLKAATEQSCGNIAVGKNTRGIGPDVIPKPLHEHLLYQRRSQMNLVVCIVIFSRQQCQSRRVPAVA